MQPEHKHREKIEGPWLPKPPPSAALDPTADGAPIGEPCWYVVGWQWERNADREWWEPAGWWVHDWDGPIDGPYHTEGGAVAAAKKQR